MIYDPPVPACDSELPCDYCGQRDGTVQNDGMFVCEGCRIDEPIIIDGETYSIEGRGDGWVQIAGPSWTWQGTIAELKTMVDEVKP